MKKIIKILMERDGMDLQEAKEVFNDVKSEMEVQRKYPDLLVIPKNRENDFKSVMIEFKYLKKGEENKLKEQIHNEKKKLIKKFPYLKNKISLKESNKAYSIF